MSELRVGAPILCADGQAGGTISAFIVDPVASAVTHLVVGVDHLGTRVVVPLAVLGEAHPDHVTITLTAEELLAGEVFDEPDYKTPDEGWHSRDIAVDPGSYYLQPFASPIAGWSLTSHERVPKGEVTFRRGVEVHSADGHHVGKVDELLVDPSDGHITHVVVREGHLRLRDVVVPVMSVARFADGKVVLDLDAAALEALPHLPVARHGHVQAS